MSKQTERRRRWLRRTLIGGGIAMVAILLFLALLPVFIGWGLFHGVVRDAIGASFNGDVEVKGLALNWFGTQEIEELSITAPGGDAEAHLALRLERGLLPLVFGSADYGTLHLGGTVEGVRYEDGSTSIQKLLKEKEETEPLEMRVRIISDGIDVSLRDLATDEVLALRALSGEVLFDPTGKTKIEVDGGTSVAGRTGALKASGSIDRLYGESGFIDLRGAAFGLRAEVSELPVAVLDGLLGLEGRLSAAAGDAIHSATLNFDGGFDDGRVNVALEASHISLAGHVGLKEGAAVVDASQPVEISLRVPADSFARLVGSKEDSVLAIAEGGEAAAEIRIEAARIPLPGESGLDLSGASVTASLITSRLPLRVRSGATIEQIDVDSLTVSIESADLTEMLTLAVHGAAATAGEDAGSATAHLDIASPIAPDGRFTIDPANIEGSLEVRQVPTSLAQALLGDSPIVLARDLGPRADVMATFSAGTTRTVQLTLAAHNASADVRASIGADGAITGESAIVEIDLQQELLADVAPFPVSLPEHFSANIRSFTIPARLEGGSFNPAMMGADGTIALAGAVIVAAPDAGDPLEIEKAQIDMRSDALGEGISLNGTLSIEGGEIEVREEVSGLFSPEGEFTPLDGAPIGTLTVRGITREHIATFAPDLALKLEPLIGESMGVAITTREAAGGALAADATLTAEGGSATLTAQRDANRIVLTALTGSVALTPELSHAWQPDSEDPIEASADKIALALASPATLFTRGDSGYEVALDEIALTVQSQEVIIQNAPALANPVVLRQFAGDINANLGEAKRLKLNGAASLHASIDAGGAGGERHIADVMFALDMPLAKADAVDGDGDQPAVYPVIALALTDIDVYEVESVLEREAGSLARFLGPSGGLTIDLNPTAAGFEATLTPSFPYVSGTFHAQRDETHFALAAEDATFTLSAAALGEYLSPAADDAAPAPGAPVQTITVATDVPLRVDINALRFPAGIVRREALASTAAEIDIAIAIREPLALSRTVGTAPAETAQFDELALAVTGDDLDAGISLALNGVLKGGPRDGPVAEDAAAGEREEAIEEGGQQTAQGPSRARIDIAATLSDLVNDAMMLDTANAVLAAQARIRRTPTWIADAAAGTGSLLADALGAAITAEVNAEDFSPNSGTLTANIGGANESRIRAKLTGRDGGYAAERGDPITGALTLSPELRNRLLHSIHPIFSDVRNLNEQVRFKVRNAFIPASEPRPSGSGSADTPLPSVEEPPRRRARQGVRENAQQPAISENAGDPTSSIVNHQSSIDFSRLSGIIELTIGPAEFTAGSEFLRILQFVETAQGGGAQPQTEGRTIEGYIGPLDGSPIIIKIDNGRLTYENFIVHLAREEPPEAQPGRRRDRRDREGAEPQAPRGEEGAAAPAEYAHHLLFSGDVDLVNKRVNRIVGAYPLADLASTLRRGVPSGGGGGVLPDIATVGVRFFGELYDAAGNPLDLQMEIDFNLKIENIFEEGLKLIPAEDAPGLQRLLEEIFGN